MVQRALCVALGLFVALLPAVAQQPHRSISGEQTRSIEAGKWGCYMADGAVKAAAICGRRISRARSVTTNFRSRPARHTTNGVETAVACGSAHSALQDKRTRRLPSGSESTWAWRC